jgi:hypothetical protein
MRAIVLVLFAGLAACLPVRTYSGPQLPRAEVATIRGAVNYYGLSWVKFSEPQTR